MVKTMQKSSKMDGEPGKCATLKTERGNSKIDPSFKSKRYRDKLRTEIKGLECLIPVDRTVLHRKLDSQTVFRLVISFLRIKLLFKALGFPSDKDNAESKKSADDQSTTNTDGSVNPDPERYFQGKNIFQILDGFLLTATTDGTLLYASDNVLQYLGFNQVDLMHRCLYGLVHHDDHFTLKTILEQTITTNQESEGSANSKGVADVESVSFICRMKCFNGTSAGYLKIHCAGKVEHIPNLNLKTNRGLQCVVILYCQPFMLTGNDITYDVKQNVFWSKHDMDLTIKELDKKALDIIGYDQEELNDSTLYKYVHPEDLVTFAACHRMLTESTEVQTMYFRMESKDGLWIWLHSRGKVISKNSKKFSIVFTHCPVREEDSTFLQQETALRQRYAINDLQYFVQNGQYNLPLPRNDSDLSNEDIHGMQKISNFCSPHMGFTEDVSLTFYSPLVTCPSSWHAMSDRHSPVLPSTHVAHKITQREKQLQFQEFKRRQQQEKQCQRPEDYSYNYNGFHDLPPQSFQPSPNTAPAFSAIPPTYIKPEPPDTYGHTQCFQSSNVYPQHFSGMPMQVGTPSGSYSMMHHPMHPMAGHGFPYHSQHQMHSYNFPPSPPISPMKYQQYPLSGTFQNQIYHFYPPVPDAKSQTYVTNMHSSGNVPPSLGNNAVFHCASDNKTASCEENHNHKRTNLKSKNIQFSLHCEPSNKKSRDEPTNHIEVTTSLSGQSCAMARNCCPGDRIEYDIEASIHMKIVENPCRRSSNSKEDIDLPSIGSFLEYLND